MTLVASRLLLYLSAAGASCALLRNGQLSEVQYLPAEEEGWEAFNAVLMAHPDSPVAIAVDSVDEIYRGETLPRAWGRDRAEMTARRLRQLVHQSPYRTALRQGPERNAPTRGDRYLVMGLTNPEQVRPWLDIMHLRAAPLAGIWLLPALSDGLIRRFELRDANLLLVSEQTGGLRLSYLESGELRFSRLAPVDGSQYDNPLEGYAEEIGRTRQALVGQRLITREKKIKVILLDPLGTLNDLHAFLTESAGFQCESINRSRLIEALDLPPELLAESADALYLRLLAHAPANANLRTADQRAASHSFWLRRGLRFAAAAWLSLSLGATLLLMLDTWRLDRQTASQRHHTQEQRAQEAALLASAGGAGQVAQRLGAVEAWKAVHLRDRLPTPTLQAVLAAAAEDDGTGGKLRLGRLTWSNDTRPRLAIEGEIPFDGDYRGAHARVTALAERLRQRLPGKHIVVTAWPLDTRPEQTLEGQSGHGTQPARFQLSVEEAP